jgi:hypothetical protein
MQRFWVTLACAFVVLGGITAYLRSGYDRGVTNGNKTRLACLVASQDHDYIGDGVSRSGCAAVARWDGTKAWLALGFVLIGVAGAAMFVRQRSDA